LPTVASRAGWAGIPAEDRRAIRRARLLDAAFELLGTEGWSATTVRAVCQAAQLNPRYFYESFEHLDALLVAVYDRTVTELAEVVFAPVDPSHAEPAAQVHAVLTRIVDFVAADPRRGRVLYVEALGNEALNRRRIDAGHGLVELLERGMGRIPAAFLVGGFGEVLRGWLDGRIDVSKAKLVDDASALFLAVGEAAGRVAGSPGGRPG
jgi:AcrR family transcriptional regulator